MGIVGMGGWLGVWDFRHKDVVVLVLVLVLRVVIRVIVQ